VDLVYKMLFSVQITTGPEAAVAVFGLAQLTEALDKLVTAASAEAAAVLVETLTVPEVLVV
jgi:hypothetical protein